MAEGVWSTSQAVQCYTQPSTPYFWSQPHVVSSCSSVSGECSSREQHATIPTLIPAIFHQPARNADDIMQDTLREVLQRHLLLSLHFIIPTDQVQDEDRWDWLGVSCHQAAELRFQGLLAPLKEGFLAQNSRRTEAAQGFRIQLLTSISA